MSQLPILHIGNKNYSSWSLRPYLALRWGKIAFEEHLILLGADGYGAAKNPSILAVSKSGRVPALTTEQGTIWDSMAICEWAAERASKDGAALWPGDAWDRARARCAASEMHSGFAALRFGMPMNIRRRTRANNVSEEARSDIARVEELWRDLRGSYADRGPFLFGERSIADAMFAPVCTRFRTYGVDLDETARAYCDTMFADEAFREWERAAEAEPWSLEATDRVHAAD